MKVYQYIALINHKDDKILSLLEYKENLPMLTTVTVEFQVGRKFTGKVKAENTEIAEKLILDKLLAK